jgi:hypothetical protein
MAGYLLITDLRHPAEVQAKLATPMFKVGTCVVVPPDSVRVDLLHDIDLSDKADLDLVVRSITQAVHDCDEKEAQLGYFGS